MLWLREKSDKAKEREIKNVLSKVRQDYPEITERIDVIYANLDSFTMFIKMPAVIVSEAYFPIIIASARWYKLSEEIQKSLLAHELGHILQRDKNQNPGRLKRIDKWYNGFNDMILQENDYIVGENPKRDRILEKAQKILEMHTDTQAARRGCGQGLLEYLKSDISIGETKEFEGTPSYDILKRIREARIKNLEELLEK